MDTPEQTTSCLDEPHSSRPPSIPPMHGYNKHHRPADLVKQETHTHTHTQRRQSFDPRTEVCTTQHQSSAASQLYVSASAAFFTASSMYACGISVCNCTTQHNSSLQHLGTGPPVMLPTATSTLPWQQPTPPCVQRNCDMTN